MLSPHHSVTEDFRKFFSVEVARSAQQLDEIYGLRYRVYCEDLAYESATAHPDHRESDEFDDRSLHCLIRHNSSGLAAGCVRVIEATGDIDTAPLPIEKHCIQSINIETLESMRQERHTICEVSRLAIDGRFRRRSGKRRGQLDELEPLENCCHRELKSFSLIAAAGFLGATALTELSGRTNVYVMMETYLPRLLSRAGIHFKAVGKAMDYHGIRAPYFISTYDALKHMNPELQDFYADIRDSFQPAVTDYQKVG